jgi:hypothetical protein
MRKLYVLSKPVENKPYLIGELTEENGEYTFEYKLGGSFPKWFLQIDEFPDPNTIYHNDVVHSFISRFIPARNQKHVGKALNAAGLTKYDEWELLKYFGPLNMKEDAYLYESLPQGVITYEN